MLVGQLPADLLANLVEDIPHLVDLSDTVDKHEGLWHPGQRHKPELGAYLLLASTCLALHPLTFSFSLLGSISCSQ